MKEVDMSDRTDTMERLTARLQASWFTADILDSLATVARAFAARFPSTLDGRFDVAGNVALAIVTLEEAIEVQTDGAITENWLLHNIVTDLLRILLTRLQAIAPDRHVTLLLARNADLLASRDVTLDASAAHVILAGLGTANDDLGSGGTAYLDTPDTATFDGSIDFPASERQPPGPVPLEPCVTVPLYYATDRAPVGAADGSATWFGVDRGDLRFGVVKVKVPRDRELGALTRRKRWYQVIDFDADARTHIHSAEELSEDAFYASLTGAVAETRRHRVFVFVHGYNVPFDDAAARAAQLHVDLQFDGVPMLYSWPSAGSWDQYFRDGATIEASRHTFAGILRRITSEIHPEELHILAHSMGSRAVARALEQLAVETKTGGPLVGQLIFAAPDVDAHEMQNMLPHLATVAKRVTIYGSSQDWPLTFSAFLAGWRRAGDGGANLLVATHAESVDASEIDTAFLAHSYVAENGTLLADMHALIERNESADRRYGLNKRAGGGYTLKSRYRP